MPCVPDKMNTIPYVDLQGIVPGPWYVTVNLSRDRVHSDTFMVLFLFFSRLPENDNGIMSIMFIL